MIEVFSKENLPLIDPPEIAFVRNEGLFYYCFAEGWRRVDNSFLVSNIQKISGESILALLQTKSYREMVRLHYGAFNGPLAEVNDHEFESGKILFDGGKMFCIQDQVKPYTWMGRNLKQIGVEVLREGTPGIHLQDEAFRQSFMQWHPEPIGFVICRGAAKGATTISCSVCPPSVATQIHTEYKQMVPTTIQQEPGPYLRGPAGHDQPGVPYRFSNEMWLTSPWRYIDIDLIGASSLGESWPEGLTRTLTFSDPVPLPMFIGSCAYLGPNDFFLPDPHPGFGWISDGGYMDTLGRTSISARMTVGRKEATAWPHRKGTTNIRLYAPFNLPPGWSRHSRLRGIAEGDYVCFDGHRRLYEVTGVSQTATSNPLSITISPGLEVDLVDSQGMDATGTERFNDCYWVPARDSNLTMRCFGWTDPFGSTGIPLYVKAITNKTLELVAPLPADLPPNTKMYMWSSVENETMTYAYRDPYSYTYRRAFQKRLEEIEPQIQEHNLALDEEARLLNQYRLLAYEKAKERWFTPPYSQNSDLNEWFPTGTFPYNTFHEGSASIRSRRIAKPTIRSSDIEYISLLNYRKI